MFIFDARSACMVQFYFVREEIRAVVEAAFAAIGRPEQAEDLRELGATVIRYLTRNEPDKDPSERNFPRLTEFALTRVDYTGFGPEGLDPKSRGIRLVRKNGPVIRAVGGTEQGGQVDMIFYRLSAEEWLRFLQALGIDPEFKSWPTWIQLMPQVDPDYSFLQPLNFC